MWQPPTFPGAGTPIGPPPPGAHSQPWETPAAQPWGHGPGQWGPPPGAWWPPQPPVRRRRSRRFVLSVVGGSVLGALVLVALLIGAFAAGQAAGEAAASASASPSVTQRPPSPATGLGSDPELDAEAARCHDGDMGACDDLYDQSDPMSTYEQYGMTCGGRVKPFDVESCSDLD